MKIINLYEHTKFERQNLGEGPQWHSLISTWLSTDPSGRQWAPTAPVYRHVYTN